MKICGNLYSCTFTVHYLLTYLTLHIKYRTHSFKFLFTCQSHVELRDLAEFMNGLTLQTLTDHASPWVMATHTIQISIISYAFASQRMTIMIVIYILQTKFQDGGPKARLALVWDVM